MKYRVVVRFPDGRKRCKISPTLELAKKVEAKFRLQSVERQVFPDSNKKAPTLNEAFKRYAKQFSGIKRSWRNDNGRYEQHIKPYLGNKCMDYITPQDIQDLINRMRSSKTHRGGDYAPATMRQVFALVRRIFNWSIRMGICPELSKNPHKRVELMKFDNSRTNPLTKTDLKKLMDTLDEWENERAVLVIKFLLYTGKRRGEALSLTWDNVDLEQGMIVLQSKNTKNGRTQILPVNGLALDLLKRANKLRVSELVFPCSTGKYMHNIGVVWSRIRKKAGLDGVRIHDLRHTYASYLVSSGQVDIYTLQRLLGHQSITMTSRYAHLAPDTLRKATNVADEVFQDF
jgi:integrase